MGIWIIIGTLGVVLLIVCISAAVSIISENSKRPFPLTDTDANKFAELLVAEIRLSNIAKTEEGLAGRKLHQTFQKEIEKAFRTYKSRVANPEQFKYFDRALVKVLADGNRQLLGKEHFRNFG